MSRRLHNGLILLKALGVVIAAGALVWLGTWPLRSWTASRFLVVPASRITPTAAQVDVALRRAGLNPDALAACGVSVNETTAIVTAVRSALTTDPDLVEGPEETLGQEQKECDALLRLVRSGLASEQDINDCQTARTDADEARATRDGVLDDLFTDLIAGLDVDVRNRLTSVRGNAGWDLPVVYKVVTRNEADWVHLRAALANERIAAKYGEDPDEAEQDFLSDVRSDAAVALAMTTHEAAIDDVTDAWNNALDGQ